MQKLELKDLLSALSPQEKAIGAEAQTSNATQQFLSAPSQQIKQLPLKEQLKIKRESTYRNTQQETDKWIGIVKLNREKDTLNLVKKDKDNAASINFFPSTPISQLQHKIEGKLQQMSVSSQKSVMKQQEAALAKVSKEEAQERLREARSMRTTQFNEEIKRRRMAKIKSKLYRKIKKRQKLREEVKRVGDLQGEQRKDYMQKLAKQRIKERITLRHRSKSQHIQNLLRFSKNNKQGIQDTLNEVNAIRQQQLQKLNEEFRENMSEELDESNYREQLEEFQKQIDEMENQQEKPEGLDTMRFMQVGKQKELQREREELKQMAQMVGEVEGQQEEEENQEKQLTRKVFGEGQNKSHAVTSGNFIQRNLKKVLGGDLELTEGIDVSKLKEKYQPQRSELNLTDAIKLHKEAFGNDVVEENYREFEKQKYADIEAELPEEKKALKGWGSWAGPGISEPKIDHAAEVRKKLAKIEQIKKKRRDGEMSGVIIRETYNKNLKDYFVNKLPHNMKSPEQFDYLQREVIGPEWNTLTQFTSNVQPKVLTKAGQVIEPVTLPRHLVKTKK